MYASGILGLPRLRERISDDDWNVGDASNAAAQSGVLGDWPAAHRRAVFVFLEGQLIIETGDPLPPWLPRAIQSLDELGCLPANWDSYGAERTRRSDILATVELLLAVMRNDTPLPSFVPTHRRTILLEWHMRGLDLEVEVLGQGRLHVACEDTQDGTEWEAQLSSDLTKLVNCIERLSA